MPHTERFLPKRGDVLFCSADLPHGGGAISANHTQKSIVTHYCPVEVVPSYFEQGGRTEIGRYEGNAFYSSGYYGGKNKEPQDGVAAQLVGESRPSG